MVAYLASNETPAALIASGGLFVTRIAIERTSVKELFQTVAVLWRQFARMIGNRQWFAASAAGLVLILKKKPPVVIANPTWNVSSAFAKWTADAEMRGDSFPNEGDFV